MTEVGFTLEGAGDNEQGEWRDDVRVCVRVSVRALVRLLYLPQSCQKMVLHVFRWKTAGRINSLLLCMGDNKDRGKKKDTSAWLLLAKLA